MKTYLLLISLCCTSLLNAQTLNDWLKMGSVLMYRLDVNDHHYDVEATITQVKPFAFQWRIADSANASGSVRHTGKAIEKGNILYNQFLPGDTLLNENTTSLVVSDYTYQKATKRRNKPFSIQLKQGSAILMGVVAAQERFKILLNGTAVFISERSIKPVVKLAGRYITTGDELVTFYNDARFPLILKVRSGFYLELLAIKTP